MHALFEGTVYEGLTERHMYASAGKSAFLDAITEDVLNSDYWRWASNFSGGNLNRNDNFWTYFDPEQGLVTFLDGAIIEAQQAPAPPAVILFGAGILVLTLFRSTAALSQP